MKVNSYHQYIKFVQHKYPAHTLIEDPIIQEVVNLVIQRSEKGMETYGCTLADAPETTVEWIEHAIEEALDFACYLTRLKRDL